MKRKTVRDVDLAGRRTLVRVDFNVPLEAARVTDATRIRAALPTIEYLVKGRARIALLSHLGRPKGQVVEALRMDPVAAELARLLDRPVPKLDDCVGPEVERAVASLSDGEIVLLENVRFHPGETANDEAFARKLAAPFDLYVNDAFGASHRAHASTVGVAGYLPAVAGFLMERELEVLGRVRSDPERPFAVILGGAKVSDKIELVESLLDIADLLLVGGGMANTFLKAQGYAIGASLVEDDRLDIARKLLAQAGGKLLLPTDVVAADAVAEDARRRTVPMDQVPEGWRILDIGPDTIHRYREAMDDARMVLWNGPMGVFEIPAFAEGTLAIARAVADSGAVTVVGGGDSVAALEQAGVADRISHVSTGGGAMLKFLEGKPLSGVEALQKAD